jgi:RND family efflux transporter MFP subunit
MEGQARRFALAATVAISAIACPACRHPEAVPPPPTQAVLTTEVHAKPEPALARRGSVTAGARLRLGFNGAGVLATLDPKTGDVVKKGQLLARLKDADAAFALRAAEARKGRAQRDFSAADALVTKGSLPPTERDNAQSALQVALANESLAAEALGQRVLRSPITGTVLERLAEPGEAVGPGTPVLVVEDTKRLVVKVGLTERELARTEAGRGASLVLDDGSAPLAAQVTSIAPAPGDDGLYSVEVSPPAAKAALRPGTLVTVRFDEQQAAPSVRMPLDAVVYRQDKTWVFVVPDGSSARLREVQVDRADGKDVLVRSGLTDGERIVREGAQFLQDGQAVRVVD